MTGWPALVRLAQQQYGLVERSQVESCGVAASTLDRRAAREGWDRPQPGVVALPGSVDSWERRILAAVLAAGHGALATGWTAAYLYGLVPAPRLPVTIVLDHAVRAPVLRDARAVRTRTLDPADARVMRGIPVVSPARMLAELAAVTDLDPLRALAIDACQKRLVTPDEIFAMWQRLQGKPGTKRLMWVALGLLEEVADSIMEWQLRALLRTVPLPPPDPTPVQVVHEGRVVGHVDVGWSQWRVGVECDGFRYHSQREQLERDTARQNALVEADWTILRLTWNLLQRQPHLVVEQLRALLRRAGCDC